MPQCYRSKAFFGWKSQKRRNPLLPEQQQQAISKVTHSFRAYFCLKIPLHCIFVQNKIICQLIKFTEIQIGLKVNNILFASKILSYSGQVYIMTIFLKVDHSRPLFIYLRLFNAVDSKQMFNKILPMTGVEPRTSGIKSDHSTN